MLGKIGNKLNQMSLFSLRIFFLCNLNRSIVASESSTDECQPSWIFLLRWSADSFLSPIALPLCLSLYYANSAISIWAAIPFHPVKPLTSKSLWTVCPTKILPNNIFLTWLITSFHNGAFLRWLWVIPVIVVM